MINQTTKKCLLVGDYTHPKFHPMQGVDAQISHILNDVMTVQCSENKNMFMDANIQQFDLCISYIDLWDELMSPKQTAGLLSYVSQGGGLFVIHNGLSIEGRYELSHLMGGRYTGHAPYQSLSFRTTQEQHPIIDGIQPFQLEEEPYEFIFDTFMEKQILLEYQRDDKWYPAAWSHTYGLGRVTYLMPGHHEPTFMQPELRQFILQAAEWTAR
ncbi:ThuA domain-containing protein [Paenibacillus sp. CMAA1364]